MAVSARPSGSANSHLLSTDKAQKAAAVAIALLAIIVRLIISWRSHSTGEDALITLRYSENLANGHGFVYNRGEHVLGVTTPLYALMLAAFISFHIPGMLAGKLCCIAAEGVTVWLIARLMARPEMERPVEGLFAAALYAFTSTPISVSISGMETSLVTCAGMGMIYAYVAKQEYALYILGAILVLLRIDGLLLLGVLAGAMLLRTRKLPARPAAIALIIIVPWLLFALAYFHSPIPTSIIAKLTVYQHPSYAPAGRFTPANLEAFRTQFLGGPIQIALTALAALGIITIFGNALFRQPRGLLAAPVAWCLVYYAVMLTSRVPAFAWYFLPPWPIYILCAVIAGATAPIKLAKERPDLAVKFAEYAVPGALAVLCLLSIVHLRSVYRDIANAQALEDEVRRPCGEWLRAHLLPGERVMLEPIGYIGYYSRAHVIDTIGLVSPEVLPIYAEADNPRLEMINRLRPEWLCLRGAEEEELLRLPNSPLKAMYSSEWVYETDGPDQLALYHIRQDKPARKAH